MVQQIANKQSYWKNLMADFSESPELGIRLTHADQIPISIEVSIFLPEKIKELLENFSKKYQLSAEAVLFCSWAILLSRYSSKEDLVFGSLFDPSSLEPSPVRIYLDPANSALELMVSIENQLLESRKNQCSLSEIQSYIGLPNRILFTTLFSLGKKSEKTRAANDNPLSITIFESKNIGISVNFDKTQYSEISIKNLLGHFQVLLYSILENPIKRIHETSMLDDDEKNKLLFEWNKTGSEFPRDKTIYKLFEEQVEKTPDRIAVIYEDQSMTYRELNNKANRLARYLQNFGVKSETLVAISMERSLELIIGILGILKSGAAYVPLDPTFPEGRLDFILKDSSAPFLITTSNLRKKFVKYSGKSIYFDLDQKDIEKQTSENTGQQSTPENLAYVIYTSGSTGNPKGVLIEHKGVVNFLVFSQKNYPTDSSGAFLLKTNITFDVSVHELFGWVLGGGKLIIAKQGDEKDPNALLRTIEKCKVTHVIFIPTVLQFLLRDISEEEVTKLLSLKYIFSAGEAINKKLVVYMQDLLKNQVRFENMYGPTETTIYSTTYNLNEKFISPNTPIGKPLANTKVYILDKNLQLSPIGLPGELYIGGIALARGYLNLSKLTEEKFIKNHFSNDIKERLYRTGDLCRYLPDGTIEYLGRIDFQVKIRGYRIELTEIETFLAAHPKIKEAVVVARENLTGEKQLVAYCILNESHHPLKVDELKQYLKGLLPEYMIPHAFVMMDSFPLTTAGKLDRKKLPEPTVREESSEGYTAPSTDLEKKIAHIWSEILDIGQIGINDNFFGLGGHSLYAVRIVSKIRKELGKSITLSDLLKSPTIKQLSSIISETENLIEKKENPKYEKKILQSVVNFPMVISKKLSGIQDGIVERRCFHGVLDISRLTFAFECLFKKHPILTSYTSLNGIFHIQDKFSFVVEEKDLSDFSEEEAEDELYLSYWKLLISSRSKWKKGYTQLKAKLFYLKNDCSELQISVSHDIADASVMITILDELSEFYINYKNAIFEVEDFQANAYFKIERKELNQKVTEYINFWKDYAKDVNFLNLPETEVFSRSKDANAMVSVMKIASLEIDQGNAMQVFKETKSLYTAFSIEISESDMAVIEEVCKLNFLNRGYFLSAVLGIVLSKYNSGDNKNILVSFARSNKDINVQESTIGCFININQIKLSIDNEAGPIHLSKKIQKIFEEMDFYQKCPYSLKQAFMNTNLNFNLSPFKKVLFKLAFFIFSMFFSKQKINRKYLSYAMLSILAFAVSNPKNSLSIYINIAPDFFEKGFVKNLFGLEIKKTSCFFRNEAFFPGAVSFEFIKDISSRKYLLYIDANLTSSFKEKIGNDFLMFIRNLKTKK